MVSIPGGVIYHRRVYDMLLGEKIVWRHQLTSCCHPPNRIRERGTPTRLHDIIFKTHIMQVVMSQTWYKTDIDLVRFGTKFVWCCKNLWVVCELKLPESLRNIALDSLSEVSYHEWNKCPINAWQSHFMYPCHKIVWHRFQNTRDDVLWRHRYVEKPTLT